VKKGHVNDRSDYEATGRTFVCWNTDNQAQMQPPKWQMKVVPRFLLEVNSR
jgi:hypothetical protein